MSLPWLLAIACATAGCTQLLGIEDPPPGPDAGVYTQPAIASLAASVTIQHEPADRYVLVRLADLVAPVAGAVIGSSSGGVRYADADGVLTAQLTATTASGLAAIFGLKAPSITITITTPAGTRQLALDLGRRSTRTCWPAPS